MDTYLRSVAVFSFTLLLILLPVSDAAADAEIFPLNPGSTWTYRDLEGNLETLVIRQTTEKKGIPLIEASYDDSSSFYFILTSEGLFRLQPTADFTSAKPRGELSLLLRWPLDPGQTWQSPWTAPPLSFTVLDRGITIVAAGNFHDGIKIGYRPVSSPIYQGYIWFEPGVGILAQEESGYRTELVSYSISDLLAPSPVKVSGEKLAGLFKPPKVDTKTRPRGVWSGTRDLLLSGPFYLFLLLIFMGVAACFAYLNSRKVEMDMKDDPDVQEGEMTLASAMVREGMYGEASEILQRLTAKHPQWPDLAALLGRAYKESGKLEEACLEFKRALTLNPDMAKARLELVRTYLNLNESSRALEEVETVLSEHQVFPDAIYLKGEVLASMGLNDDALKLFREALELNPSFSEAQKALERVLAEGSD